MVRLIATERILCLCSLLFRCGLANLFVLIAQNFVIEVCYSIDAAVLCVFIQVHCEILLHIVCENNPLLIFIIFYFRIETDFEES